jgi:hypothetical protein
VILSKEILTKFKIKRKVRKNLAKLNSFCNSNSLNTVSIEKICNYKNSDTLCVLASGNSVNRISEEEWRFIKKNDSASLNNTILHKHIPTYLFYETDSNQKSHLELNKLKFENLKLRSEELQKSAIIWHYQEKRYFDLQLLTDNNLIHNSFFQGSYSLPGESIDELDNSLIIAHKNGLTKKPEVGLYRRGSLARIIHFAIAMHYKKVIFFGADLNGPEYFFDSYRDEDFPKGCKPPVLQNYIYNSREGKKKQDKIHMTVDPSVHPVTMINVIERMNKNWCKSDGLILEVFNSDSALADILEIAANMDSSI